MRDGSTCCRTVIVSDEEEAPFVDVLAMGVEAWDRWKERAEVGEREALIEQARISHGLSDMIMCNPVEVARLLVLMCRALEREALLYRSESRLDMIERSIEYVTERIDNSGMV